MAIHEGLAFTDSARKSVFDALTHLLFAIVIISGIKKVIPSEQLSPLYHDAAS